ncbi:transcription factor NF-E2 45 kDa subunit [Denticeps clupeoides]|uniref:BZIP domain-containing protein n=1 Tax=Denticeps clupeoides TaxID=299321 RepID=A0AAY4C0M2_9TELE|nr:transcription factor NF-E2 45 kDa subunit [Denticeps clupeoides]
MCSAADCVLPLRRTCEGLANPARLHGGASMPIAASGFRPHRHPQDPEMDFTWQELMAITDLPEFEVPGDNTFEPNPYLHMEPVVPAGSFGMNPAQAVTLTPACDPQMHAPAYDGSFAEAIAPCQRLGLNVDPHYGPAGPQPAPRLNPGAPTLQPPLMSLLEHMNLAGGSQGLDKDIRGQRPARGKQSGADDLESDSGLSLGSSPPLASPETGMAGTAAYIGPEAGVGYGEGEMDTRPGELSRMRPNLLYPADYQHPHPLHAYPGPHPSASFFPASCGPPPGPQQHQHHHPPPKQHQALHDLHLNSSATSYPKARCSGGTPVALSRDERRALALKIPFPLEKIVNLPVDDFNELLTQCSLSDAQLALVRDIRRRGKNKVAAQNCRKRKLENIVHLEGELGQLRAQREHLSRERLDFQQSLAVVKCRLAELHATVFSQLRDQDGRPYSLDDYSLQQAGDGGVYLVPREPCAARGCQALH